EQPKFALHHEMVLPFSASAGDLYAGQRKEFIEGMPINPQPQRIETDHGLVKSRIPIADIGKCAAFSEGCDFGSKLFDFTPLGRAPPRRWTRLSGAACLGFTCARLRWAFVTFVVFGRG